jgi:hypothetical protein
LKGVVFNLLEHLVSKEAGETAWERAEGKFEIAGTYTSLGTNSHGEPAPDGLRANAE